MNSATRHEEGRHGAMLVARLPLRRLVRWPSYAQRRCSRSKVNAATCAMPIFAIGYGWYDDAASPRISHRRVSRSAMRIDIGRA